VVKTLLKNSSLPKSKGPITLKYEDRLKYLNFPTMKYTRLRGDMTDAYKIFTGKYDASII